MHDAQCTVSCNLDLGHGEPAHFSVSAHPMEIMDAVLAAREAAIYGLMGKTLVEKKRAEHEARKAEEAEAEKKKAEEYVNQKEVEELVRTFMKHYGMFVKGDLHVTGNITCDNNVTAYIDEPINCCDKW